MAKRNTVTPVDRAAKLDQDAAENAELSGQIQARFPELSRVRADREYWHLGDGFSLAVDGTAESLIAAEFCSAEMIAQVQALKSGYKNFGGQSQRRTAQWQFYCSMKRLPNQRYRVDTRYVQADDTDDERVAIELRLGLRPGSLSRDSAQCLERIAEQKAKMAKIQALNQPSERATTDGRLCEGTAMNAAEQRAHLREVLGKMAILHRDVLRGMLTRDPDRERFGFRDDDIDRMVQMQVDFGEALLRAVDAAPIEDMISAAQRQRLGLRLVVDNSRGIRP